MFNTKYRVEIVCESKEYVHMPRKRERKITDLFNYRSLMMITDEIYSLIQNKGEMEQRVSYISALDPELYFVSQIKVARI